MLILTSLWRLYGVTRQSCITLVLQKCFHCVSRHGSYGFMDKIAMKSGIKGVEVVQMLVFSSKGVENGKFWRHYDVTSKKTRHFCMKQAVLPVVPRPRPHLAQWDSYKNIVRKWSKWKKNTVKMVNFWLKNVSKWYFSKL